MKSLILALSLQVWVPLEVRPLYVAPTPIYSVEQLPYRYYYVTPQLTPLNLYVEPRPQLRPPLWRWGRAWEGFWSR